jgi:hypothetical protein
MDNLALIYESNAIVSPQTFRENLVNDILYYHENNKVEKRDALLAHITEAETEYLVEQGLVNEIFGGAPAQRSIGGAIKDKVAGAFKGEESGTRNKLTEIYQKVWAEYMNYVRHISTYAKQQRGLGGNAPTAPESADTLVDFLMKVLKIDPKIINAAFTGAGQAQDAPSLAKKDIGAIIYKALQLRYQGNGTPAAYQSKFQLPASL